MYSKISELVFGFHGCDEEVARQVINGDDELRPSNNDYDWLGNGIYFWEQNYDRAYEWAINLKRLGKIQTPSVIGAVIDLGTCLNMLDGKYISLLTEEYLLLESEYHLVNMDLPVNKGRTKDKLLRNLDCAVIEHLHATLAEDSPIHKSPFDSARGLFTEGDEIYPGAGFRTKNHIQICVRNPNCIKAYFWPRVQDNDWPMP